MRILYHCHREGLITNLNPMGKLKSFEMEMIRATKFLVRQIKRKYTPEEAFAQVKGSYGLEIHDAVFCSVRDSLKLKS